MIHFWMTFWKTFWNAVGIFLTVIKTLHFMKSIAHTMAMAINFHTQASKGIGTYVPGFISDYTSNWILLLLVWSLI